MQKCLYYRINNFSQPGKAILKGFGLAIHDG